LAAARSVLRALAAATLLVAGAAAAPPRAPAPPGGPKPPAPAAAACLDCHAPHYARHGDCVGCHRGDACAVRPDLAHHRLLSGAAAAWALPGSPVLPRATALRDSLGCRRCHVTGARGERLAISLDTVAWPRTQAELRQALVNPAAAMPSFGLSARSADTLAAVLLRDADRFGGSPRYQVRFRAGSDDSLRTFARLCGGCHRALTPDGPQGKGADGPDLSGLTGAFHPAAADSAWTRARLERWLRSPRAVRPQATMLPVAARPDELDAVLRAVTPPPTPPPSSLSPGASAPAGR
jgi:hypothetical protein